jgi:hypothetical protein
MILRIVETLFHNDGDYFKLKEVTAILKKLGLAGETEEHKTPAQFEGKNYMVSWTERRSPEARIQRVLSGAREDGKKKYYNLKINGTYLWFYWEAGDPRDEIEWGKRENSHITKAKEHADFAIERGRRRMKKALRLVS